MTVAAEMVVVMKAFVIRIHTASVERLHLGVEDFKHGLKLV